MDAIKINKIDIKNFSVTFPSKDSELQLYTLKKFEHEVLEKFCLGIFLDTNFCVIW